MNNDTHVNKDWLKALVKVADEHPNAGMVGSRICSFDDPDALDSLGVKICLDGLSRGAFRNRRFSELGFSGTLEILLPSACAALYKRRMLEEIGFFDEIFFAYCEDTDLGLRGRFSGWAALLNTDAIVYHKYSQVVFFLHSNSILLSATTIEKLVASFPEKKVFGIDTEPENIEICHKHQIPIQYGSIYDIPFDAVSFDCVFYF